VLPEEAWGAGGVRFFGDRDLAAPEGSTALTGGKVGSVGSLATKAGWIELENMENLGCRRIG
jgi:hypothetical protein